MHNSRLRCCLALSYVLTFMWCLAACQSGPTVTPKATGKGQDSFTCGDKSVYVVPVDGTAPKDVYLCQGDTLTWMPNNHTFTVTFPKKYPFVGNPMTFQNDPQNPNNPVTSPAAKNPGLLVVYHYDMTVDGSQVIDPQVVGGGWHSN